MTVEEYDKEHAAPLLIRGGRVWDPDGDTDLPSVRDIVVERGVIASLSQAQDELKIKEALVADAARGKATAIDARGKLVMPGFVNAHYHSYDTLAKGLMEDEPFDVWAMHSQPAYFGKRSKAELRVRTMLGAIECLKNGITTVQDMCTLVPFDEETLDVIAAAYRDVGIRVVFSIALRDAPELDIAPFLPSDISEEVRALVTGSPRDPFADLEFVERQLLRVHPNTPRWHWALSMSGPQRSSRGLLEGLADLTNRHHLPIFTHAYETKAQAAKARAIYAAHGGSMIGYLADLGLLTPRTNLAHGVWLTPLEIDLIAQSRAGVIHNPMSNMKLKSGVAPIQRLQASGVNLALGCDNCSCGDCQNMFQAMKLFCLLAAVADPNPAGVHAHDAVRAATLGGARAVGLDGQIGRIDTGLSADLIILDLSDLAYMPLNSVVRQLVFSDSGRSVETTIVDGQILMRDRQLLTVDEAAFRSDLANVMPAFRQDFDTIKRSSAAAVPHLLEANARVAKQDVGLNRFLAET
jgi:cytosine/adenosine deaminase-related metal-dependent hydrolase